MFVMNKVIIRLSPDAEGFGETPDKLEAGGAAQVFNAGDAFFIPKGTECRASVANNIRMYIAVVKSS